MDQSQETIFYEELADALNALPNGFPRTPSNVEIPLLQKIFTPAEAALARHLGRELEPVDVIARRAGLDEKMARTGLIALAKRRLIWFNGQRDNPRFRLSPFVVGIYEMQWDNMDHEMAHLIEHYMADGGAAGIMRPDPAIHRVVPAQSAARSAPFPSRMEVLLWTPSDALVAACVSPVVQTTPQRSTQSPMKKSSLRLLT